MSTLDWAALPVGEIAAAHPGATAVFRRFRIDFCCSGQRPLAEACAARGVSLDEVRQALEHLPQAVADVPQEPTELIEHILHRYHDVHRQQLPELIRLARKVEAVHDDHPEAPLGLAQYLEETQDELLAHMAKEEQVLFPLLAAGGAPMARHPIAAMRLEHDDHAVRLDNLRTLAHGLVLPAEACNSWRALYSGLQQFIDDLMQHIHLENNVLFPRFERA